MVILQSINYPLADNLTTIGQQWKRATIMGIGLVVAIISYIILGSRFGVMGASIAAVLTEVTLLIDLLYLSVKVSGYYLKELYLIVSHF